MMLEVAGLQASYGRSRVLFDVSLSVGEGEVVTLLGRNGMGKTTTIRSIMGLTRPLAGAITFSGTAIAGETPEKIARRGVGLVPEGREQQMLAIGRALMTNPRLLILDEATEGLAPLLRAEIWSCLSALKQQGQSILIVDKNLQVLKRLADRHFIIEKGRTVWSGDGAAMTRESELVHRYVGI
jgi:branched-chain amino acid transport system ATP-binding protein